MGGSRRLLEGLSGCRFRRGQDLDSGDPECDLGVALPSGAVVRVSVTIDSAPQAYFRLERAAVEAEQVFGTVRLEPAPVNVTGMGLDAYWLPAERHVTTTDGVRLITAQVSWAGESEERGS
jgi:hypothetical protein